MVDELAGMDLAGLEARRAVLFAELALVGDFRRGSLNAVRRRCGKANCACAGAGACRSRSAVQPDPVGGWQDGERAGAARPGAGQGHA